MHQSIVALEQAEMDANADVFRAAGPDIVAAAGLQVDVIGDALLTAANRIDVLALNRVTGLGVRRQVTPAEWSTVLQAIERTGAPRFFVQVAPVEGHEAAVRLVEGSGLRHYNNWIRLCRSLDDLPPIAAEQATVSVRRIDVEHAEAFGRIVASAFQYPPAIAPLAGQAVGRSGWSHYLAFAGDTPIAAAAMFHRGEAAWFGFAATDSSFRRHGAQRALIERRLADAKAAGCRWISVETAEDSVVKDAPSFRNLRRLGFEVAYTRPNYLWTRSTTSAQFVPDVSSAVAAATSTGREK